MKLIIKLLVILVLGAVALGVAGYFLLPPAADKAVNDGSLYAFGVPSTIGPVKAAPGVSNTTLGFESYVLQSPTGFDEPLLSIGKFSLGLGTTSIVGEPKKVGEFLLQDVELTLVQNGASNNIVPVLQHLRGLMGKGGATPDETKREGSAGPRLQVGRVRVEGVAGRIVVAGIPGIGAVDQRFEIPAYEADLSSAIGPEGMTVAEIAGLLVTDLKDRAMAAADGKVPGGVLSALDKAFEGGLEGGLGGAIEAGKGALIDQADEKKRELEGQLEEKSQQVKDKVEGVTGDLLEEGRKKTEGVLKGVGGLLDKKKDGR